jgi:hypothetical protein
MCKSGSYMSRGLTPGLGFAAVEAAAAMARASGALRKIVFG